jgi:hypothetical protein
MRRLLLIALLLLPLGMKAQVIDTLIEMGVGTWLATPDTVRITDTVVRVDTVVQVRMDTVVQVRVDTVVHHITDTIIKRVADTAALSVLREKEAFYRQILNTSGVDKEKLEAERNYYLHMVDSLRAIVRISEIEAVRKEEANKYLLERARAAEERVAQATNRKKKVRPIQGIAMRFFRTPNWEVRLQPRADASGNYDGTYDKIVRNRNAGSFEFDFVTGASVMLWDLTP